jgi:hypothetical protein
MVAAAYRFPSTPIVTLIDPTRFWINNPSSQGLLPSSLDMLGNEGFEGFGDGHDAQRAMKRSQAFDQRPESRPDQPSAWRARRCAQCVSKNNEATSSRLHCRWPKRTPLQKLPRNLTPNSEG